jgi:hypothetical protein
MIDIDQVLSTAGIEPQPYKPVDCALAPGCFELEMLTAGARNMWQKLAQAAEETGYYPVFPVKDDIDAFLPMISIGGGGVATPELVSELIATGRIPSFEALTDFQSYDLDGWVATTASRCKIGNFSKQRFGHVSPPISSKLLLLPVKHSWQVPAILRLGGWNAHPHPAAHVAMQKRWFDKYGAQIVSIGIDTMYMDVQRPVRTREEALALAAEHLAYCWDNVMQGMGDFTLSGAAIDLIDSNCWAFWWD